MPIHIDELDCSPALSSGGLSYSTGSHFEVQNQPLISTLPAVHGPSSARVLVFPRRAPGKAVNRELAMERLALNVWEANQALMQTPDVTDTPAWLSGDLRNEPQPLPEDAETSLYCGITVETLAGACEVSRRTSPVSQASTVLQFPAQSERADFRTLMSDGMAEPRPQPGHTISIFSLMGGTGRTSIAAGLARVFAGSGRRVLLADTCAHSLLPRVFGGGDARLGAVRRFSSAGSDAPRDVRLVSLAIDGMARDEFEQYRLLQQFLQGSAGMDRVIWDLSGASLDWSAKVLISSHQILIPLLPNATSLMQLRATQRFINQCHEEDPGERLFYVLNDFNELDPQHLEMRCHFRHLLGSRLLPVVLRRSALADAAFAACQTIVDYAPGSRLTDDLWRLADHIDPMALDSTARSLASRPVQWLEQQSGQGPELRT